MSTLERAIALAAGAHAGQADKAGAPYILHPLRVMLAVDGHAERMAAVLHDVVEDGGVSLAELRAFGFPEPVVAAVDALTRRADEHGAENYVKFVARTAQNDIAVTVKLADIADNMDLSRIASPTVNDFARVERYRAATELLEAIGRQRLLADHIAPTILPLRSRASLRDVEATRPGLGAIVACDFYIDGAEKGSAQPGGLQLGRVLNMDHHAPIERMQRRITSTALACEYITAGARARDEPRPSIVINHTDCDSILSSAIVMGVIEPDERFVAASIAADHTGEANPIADLLQGLDAELTGDRTDRQYIRSLHSLLALLAGRRLPAASRRALDHRLASREAARRMVDEGRFTVAGPLAYAILDAEIDGAFFPALIPDAELIMLAFHHPQQSGRWIVKLRLGLAAPPGLTLHSLEIQSWNPAFGGRWNAGSNRRGGGTMVEPPHYVERLLARLIPAITR